MKVLILLFSTYTFLSCRAQKPIRTEPAPEGQNPPKTSSGVDFVGGGNEPFWSVEIDFGKEMRFTPVGGKPLTVPAVEAEKSDDSTATYRSRAKAGEMIVQLQRTACTDDMSGALRTHRVTVEIRRPGEKEFTRYTGCGRYTANERLHDIWALTSIKGKAIRPEDFPRGVPNLELQIAEGSARGFGGCNNFGGPALFLSDSIRFGNLVSTMMACAGAPGTVEGQYFRAMTGTVKYSLAELKLTLTGKNGTLVFKKVD